MYLRLRQICLVAKDLAPVEEAICDVLGTQICYRDKGVATYGLHNALWALGGTFLEVVSPLEPGTAAGRYLGRRKGDGGYMYIVDCHDLEARREHFAELEARAVEDLKREADWATSEAIHLHPRDTGGCLLSVDRHSGGEDMMGEYHWAGPDWQGSANSGARITGAEMQCNDPGAVGRRWSELLKRAAMTRDEETWELAMDNAFARFVPLGDDRGEGLSSITIEGLDASGAIARANARGLKTGEDWVELCGVVVRFA